MKFVQESILSSSIRSFLKTFFGLLGIIAVVVPAILLISMNPDKSQSLPFQYNLSPDANGNKISLNENKPVILNIPIKNIIGTKETSSEKIEDILYASRHGIFENNRIKAILLEINSPGGYGADSIRIYKDLKKYSSKYNVPIYAYSENLCASAAIYIAAAADKIYAEKTTLIGSVGAKFSPFMNVADLMEKIGVKSETIYAGKNKDNMNPFRAWSDSESEPFKEIIDFYYQDFVDTLTEARPMINKEKLINEYGANVFPAKKALEIGYIDAIVNDKSEVLSELAKAANIEEYSVVSLEHSSWKKLLQEKSFFPEKILHQISLTEKNNILNY